MSLKFLQKITLDLTVSRLQNIHCSQDDNNSRNILITLSDNGVPYTIPNNISIYLKILKPDFTYIYIDESRAENLCRIGDKISIILPVQATTVHGISKAEIQLINKSTEEVVSTVAFNIIVKKSVLSSDMIVSKNDSNIINEIICHLDDKNNPHKITKEQIGLGNVSNVSTNDQIPTFTSASTRTNINSGEKLSILFGKIMKWFADLKAVAFSGSYNDLSNKPTIPNKTSELTNDSGYITSADDIKALPLANFDEKAAITELGLEPVTIWANGQEFDTTNYTFHYYGTTANGNFLHCPFNASGVYITNNTGDTIKFYIKCKATSNAYIQYGYGTTEGSLPNYQHTGAYRTSYAVARGAGGWETYSYSVPTGNNFFFGCASGDVKWIGVKNLDTKAKMDGSGNIITDTYMPKTGGYFTGNSGTTNGNRLYGGDKIRMWTDNEGGNLEIESPDGVKVQMDVNGNTFRIYMQKSDGSLVFPLNINPSNGYVNIPYLRSTGEISASKLSIGNVIINKDGDFQHATNNKEDGWGILNNAGELKFGITYEDGIVFAGNAIIIPNSNAQIFYFGGAGNTNKQYPMLKITQFTNSLQILPTQSNTCTIGHTSAPFENVVAKNIYNSSGLITSSDRNKKKDFAEIIKEFAEQIIDGLIPASFKYMDGDSGRTHYGLVAQDVEKLLEELGIDSKDFAPLIKEYPAKEIKNEDGSKELVTDYEAEPEYFLRYEGFIGLIIKYIQGLKQENKETKDKMSQLEGRLELLESKLSNI